MTDEPTARAPDESPPSGPATDEAITPDAAPDDVVTPDATPNETGAPEAAPTTCDATRPTCCFARWGLRAIGCAVALVAVLVALAAGYVVGLRVGKTTTGGETVAPTGQIWTCSMHPQIRQPKPGRCPICFMELVPVAASSQAENVGPRDFVTTAAAKALMEIETAPVERRFVTADVPMVGKIDYDETRLADITAWVGGRLDRLFVDYTGIAVRQGDHMVSLYSPELLSAQEELLSAIVAARSMQGSDIESMRVTAQATVEAARERLRLWGLTDEQVRQVEQSGKASDHVTINAPMGGVVIQKNAQEGMYVQTGTRIYTVADLDHLWLKLDAYESDLEWLRYGQKVTFQVPAYPGEPFHGTIAFIDPTLDSKTRTVKLRVNVANEDGRLKPGMFVRAVAHSRLAAGGRVIAADLEGKWICPMHPEIVKDKAGSCDICGMDLVQPKDLGYTPLAEADKDRPLVIPATAPLVTGRRAVVYVEVPDAEKPTYRGVEIDLGPRAGPWYIVRGGLSEGQFVVTRGNFKIDAALQIEARPSMMSPGGEGPPMSGHEHHVAPAERESHDAPAPEAAPSPQHDGHGGSQ